MECCRICLSSDNLANIFETEETASNITSIACVDIDVDDGFPQYICLLCKHELDISISFKGKCESTFEILKEQHAKEIEVKEEIILNVLSGGSVLDEKLPQQTRNCVLNSVKHNIMENIVASNVDFVRTINSNSEYNEIENEEQYDSEPEDMDEAQQYIDDLYNEKDADDEDTIHFANYEDEEMQPAATSEEDTSLSSYTENQMNNIGDNMEGQSIKINDLLCLVCNFNFLNEESFLNHLERLHSTTMGQCQICLLYFPTEQVLKEHLSEKHDISDVEGNIFRCKVCSNTFELQSQLSSHLCSSISKNSYRCDLCQLCFTLEVDLESHIQNSHQKEEFTCKECSKTFTGYDDYKKHLIEHRIPINEVVFFQCLKCLKFSSSTIWKQHKCETRLQGLSNNKENPYKCPKCDQSFTQQASLTAHKLTHTRNRQHICSICQMRFTKEPDLEEHLLLHKDLIKCTKEEIYVVHMENENLVEDDTVADESFKVVEDKVHFK